MIMNVNLSSKVEIDVNAFAAWVQQVAAINEEFSEKLRDTADAVALDQPAAAMALYQAADSASTAVQRLRQSMPTPRPQSVPASWMIFGFFCAGVGAMLDRLTRRAS
jgi:hypothetical protein